MSDVQSPLPKEHPLCIAWEKYKSSGEFANSKKWCEKPEHIDGSLWSVFSAGFEAAGGFGGVGALELLAKLVRRQAIIGEQIQYVERWLVANDPQYMKPRIG